VADAIVFFPLEVLEVQLTDPTELIWRQCAPGHFDKRTGKPTDAIFSANSADLGMMSGARATKSSAAIAYKHRTDVSGKLSMGTWAVSVGEIESVKSRAVDDSAAQPTPPPEPPPGHTYIDVRHLSGLDKKERQRFRSTLLIHAVNRGRQHPPAPLSAPSGVIIQEPERSTL
jgi:hypothetical protein